MTHPRFAHFHANTTYTDKHGVAHTVKGRLLATVATTELPDGTLAVGVSRCSPDDNPVRFVGRRIAQARLGRLASALRKEPMKQTQAELLESERAELLAFHMEREAFIQTVIRDGVLRRLALAANTQEAREIADTFRKSIL